MKITAQQLRDIIRREMILSEQRTPSSYASSNPEVVFTVIERTTSEGEETDQVLIGSDLGSEWFWLVEDPMSLEKGSQLTGEQINNAIRTDALRKLTDDELVSTALWGLENAEMADHARDFKAQTRESRQLSRRELKEIFSMDMLQEGMGHPDDDSYPSEVLVSFIESNPEMRIRVSSRNTGHTARRDQVSLWIPDRTEDQEPHLDMYDAIFTIWEDDLDLHVGQVLTAQQLLGEINSGNLVPAHGWE